VEQTYIHYVLAKDSKMWHNALHIATKYNIYLEHLGGYMEDLTRNYPGVWTDNKFLGITPKHVAVGKE
jgi:hypothetical protein